MSGNPREQQWHSISTCPWSEGTLPACWPVCKFDLILVILSVSTSVPAYHLPLFNAKLLLSNCLHF